VQAFAFDNTRLKREPSGNLALVDLKLRGQDGKAIGSQNQGKDNRSAQHTLALVRSYHT